MEVSNSSRRIEKFNGRPGRYHFFEGIQGNFVNYGL
jgi:hypothetical protein